MVTGRGVASRQEDEQCRQGGQLLCLQVLQSGRVMGRMTGSTGACTPRGERLKWEEEGQVGNVNAAHIISNPKPTQPPPPPHYIMDV